MPYAPEWMTNIRDPRRPRPLAHIRSPHNLHHSRQYHDSEPRLDDRDRDRDDSRGAAVEVRIVNDIIDEHPDHPVNIHFNYGPVHIYQNCVCPNPAAHTCHPLPTITTTPRRHNAGTPSPYPPLPPPPPTHRRGPNTNPPAPPIPRPRPHHPRPRSPSRPPSTGPIRGGITRVIVPSPESSDLDEPPRQAAPRRGILRTTGTDRGSAAATPTPTSSSSGATQITVGLCDGCLTRRRLVWGRYCAECEYFAAASDSEEDLSVSSPRSPVPGSSSGLRRGGGPGAWSGNGNGGAVRVRYVPGQGEPRRDDGPAERRMREREVLARERELLEREREILARERERERLRERERESMRNGARRGVRWEREVEVRDGGRDRRYYPRPTDARAYFSDSEDDRGW